MANWYFKTSKLYLLKFEIEELLFILLHNCKLNNVISCATSSSQISLYSFFITLEAYIQNYKINNIEKI